MTTEQENPFFKDLQRLLQIKRAHASAERKPENPVRQNSHSDEGFLIAFIDNLWTEYVRRGNQIDVLADERSWQPIETAPAYACTVLVYEPGSHVKEAYRYLGSETCAPAWVGGSRHMNPTHWMHFPSPPTQLPKDQP